MQGASQLPISLDQYFPRQPGCATRSSFRVALGLPHLVTAPLRIAQPAEGLGVYVGNQPSPVAFPTRSPSLLQTDWTPACQHGLLTDAACWLARPAASYA